MLMETTLSCMVGTSLTAVTAAKTVRAVSYSTPLVLMIVLTAALIYRKKDLADPSTFSAPSPLNIQISPAG